jgi:hypothetical protein
MATKGSDVGGGGSLDEPAHFLNVSRVQFLLVKGLAAPRPEGERKLHTNREVVRYPTRFFCRI